MQYKSLNKSKSQKKTLSNCSKNFQKATTRKELSQKVLKRNLTKECEKSNILNVASLFVYFGGIY